MKSLKLNELKSRFKSKFSELSIENPSDSKHREILNKAYESKKWIDNLDENNIRYWSGQTDQGAPLNLQSEIALNGPLIGPPKYLIKFFTQRNNSRELLNSLIDDIKILELIDGREVLQQNRIESTYGKTMTFKIEGVRVNTRWLRYIYLASRIKNQNLISNGKVWVDIGSFYGGLQQILYRYFPEARIIMVDFQHQLLRSYLYLNYSYPNAQHILNPDLSEKFELPGFYYLHPDKIFEYRNLKVDLLSNFFSIGELSRITALNYINSKLWREAKAIYSVNRFISSPFYDKTYDTDLTIIDYLADNSRKIRYLDVFPIGVFLRINRNVFGIKRFRNISSNYFELILT